MDEPAIQPKVARLCKSVRSAHRFDHTADRRQAVLLLAQREAVLLAAQIADAEVQLGILRRQRENLIRWLLREAQKKMSARKTAARQGYTLPHCAARP